MTSPLIIGQNIRSFRKRAKLTIAQLADLLIDYGCDPISEALLGAWQRGERSISAQHLYYVAAALHTTADALMDEATESQPPEKLAQHLSKLPLNEQQIIQHSAKTWQGDISAMIQACGMYMPLPPSFRCDVIAVLVSMYRIAKKRDLLEPVPYELHIDHLVQKWECLHDE